MPVPFPIELCGVPGPSVDETTTARSRSGAWRSSQFGPLAEYVFEILLISYVDAGSMEPNRLEYTVKAKGSLSPLVAGDTDLTGSDGLVQGLLKITTPQNLDWQECR
ncbi:hypothetical protein [Pseudarthrobacter enclensis]|uniref:Uncharacterized protein n=1 Tax=Pseudarthrobacter enclensis TaxID=993070 RepID=A0ABT9RYZ8_9MICC|nr:hypothetical protein [Pseudarthrobacter enclensis]MDP9889975.1 hypothetical protein [Pseudarthrobacter enclensis]